MSDVKEIKKMAALVVNSNKISEFHEKNMKMFPMVFFDAIKEVKIDYDLSVRHDVELDTKNNITVKAPLRNNFVSYYLTLDESKNQNLDRRFSALEGSIKTLFWKDVIVEVYFNDKIVYKSKKNG